MNWKMGFSSFNEQNNGGIMDEQHEEGGGKIESESSSSSGISSVASSESESMDEVNSSPNSSSSEKLTEATSLNDMSSLLQQLPFKRGLSRYFQGKSQSYTSLSSVRCLEDLAKPENPNHKRLKSCKSYGGLREIHHHHHHQQRNRSFSAKTLSRSVNPKKASRGSCSSVNSITRGAHSNRPPVAPHRSSSTTTFSNQAPLFV